MVGEAVPDRKASVVGTVLRSQRQSSAGSKSSSCDDIIRALRFHIKKLLHVETNSTSSFSCTIDLCIL